MYFITGNHISSHLNCQNRGNLKTPPAAFWVTYFIQVSDWKWLLIACIKIDILSINRWVIPIIYFYLCLSVQSAPISRWLLLSAIVICAPAGTVNQPNPDHIATYFEQLAHLLWLDCLSLVGHRLDAFVGLCTHEFQHMRISVCSCVQ